MGPADILALRRHDVRNAQEFGTPADVAAARSALANARERMLREWDRIDNARRPQV